MGLPLITILVPRPAQVWTQRTLSVMVHYRGTQRLRAFLVNHDTAKVRGGGRPKPLPPSNRVFTFRNVRNGRYTLFVTERTTGGEVVHIDFSVQLAQARTRRRLTGGFGVPDILWPIADDSILESPAWVMVHSPDGVHSDPAQHTFTRTGSSKAAQLPYAASPGDFYFVAFSFNSGDNFADWRVTVQDTDSTPDSDSEHPITVNVPTIPPVAKKVR